MTLGLLLGLELALQIAFEVRERRFRPFDRYLSQVGDTALSAMYPDRTTEEVRALWRETWVPFRYDPYTGYRESPREGRFVNVAPAGYRRSTGESPWPPDPAAVDVFVFGGSTTFGYGVADGETVPAEVERALGELCDTVVRVYNFGRGYYYSTQERILFERLLTAGHRPTAAVFIDGWNDSRRGDVPTFDEDLARLFEIQRGEGGLRGIVTALLIGTATGRFARGLARRIEQARPPSDATSLDEVGRRAARRWMRSVVITGGVAESAGVVPLFVVQPVAVYGFAAGTHPLAGNEGHDELRAIAGGFYREVGRNRGEAGPGEPLWLADAHRGWDPLSVFVDGGHYTAAFSAHLGRAVARDLADRLPGCGAA